MLNTPAETIEEYFAECIFANPNPSVRNAIAKTVLKFPEATATCAAFAFISLAASLETPLFRYTANDEKLSVVLYRAIAAFVADIYAVEKLYGSPVICSQIGEFWVASEDKFFVVQDAILTDTKLF